MSYGRLFRNSSVPSFIDLNVWRDCRLVHSIKWLRPGAGYLYSHQCSSNVAGSGDKCNRRRTAPAQTYTSQSVSEQSCDPKHTTNTRNRDGTASPPQSSQTITGLSFSADPQGVDRPPAHCSKPLSPFGDVDNSDKSVPVEEPMPSRLAFENGESYHNTFVPVVHAVSGHNEGTDVVKPHFFNVDGISMCSIPNGRSVVRNLFPSMCTIEDALFGCLLLLVPEGVQDEEDYLSGTVCHVPDLTTLDDGNSCENHLVIQLDSLPEASNLKDCSYRLVQLDEVPHVHIRMLEAVHDFADVDSLSEPSAFQIKKSNGAGRARLPRMSSDVHRGILCHSRPDGSVVDEDKENSELSSVSSVCTNLVAIPPQVRQRLNSCQADIVQRVFQQPLSLIQGPPGSGKTSVAAAIVETALADAKQPSSTTRKEKILVCATSNVAADNLCQKLAERGVRVCRVNARLGEVQREVPTPVQPYCLENMVVNLVPSDGKLCDLLERFHKNEIMTLEEKNDLRALNFEFETRVLRYNCDVVVTTCAGAGDSRLSGFSFPFVLIDEVTQSYEPETLIALMSHSKRVVLVGDPCQLGPVPVAGLESSSSHSQSMFDRLICAGTPTEFLDTQYRMHPALAAFSSRVFYDSKLKNGVSVEDRTPEQTVFPWPSDIPLVFWKSLGPHAAVKNSYLNESEAEKVLKVVQHLCEQGVNPNNIGIITPYAGQRAHLKDVSQDMPQKVEICSVDEFQGREKDYIIVSCVRSYSRDSSKVSVGFLDDARRLNVTLTRARFGMILIGNSDVLVLSELWKDFITDLDDRGCVVSECL